MTGKTTFGQYLCVQRTLGQLAVIQRHPAATAAAVSAAGRRATTIGLDARGLTQGKGIHAQQQ
ncbi:hypothetical protein D3C78_1644730 [compost metagenome]